MSKFNEIYGKYFLIKEIDETEAKKNEQSVQYYKVEFKSPDGKTYIKTMKVEPGATVSAVTKISMTELNDLKNKNKNNKNIVIA